MGKLLKGNGGRGRGMGEGGRGEGGTFPGNLGMPVPFLDVLF